MTDAPEFDARWRRRLMFALSDQHRIELGAFDRVFELCFSGEALEAVHETLARVRPSHRAGPDAPRLAKAWRAGARASGRKARDRD